MRPSSDLPRPPSTSHSAATMVVIFDTPQCSPPICGCVLDMGSSTNCGGFSYFRPAPPPHTNNIHTVMHMHTHHTNSFKTSRSQTTLTQAFFTHSISLYISSSPTAYLSYNTITPLHHTTSASSNTHTTPNTHKHHNMPFQSSKLTTTLKHPLFKHTTPPYISYALTNSHSHTNISYTAISPPPYTNNASFSTYTTTHTHQHYMLPIQSSNFKPTFTQSYITPPVLPSISRTPTNYFS